MLARSTTFDARPESIDAGIAYCSDEVMPALQGMDGWVGLSLLTDRESGRCILTTAWQDSAAMQASADEVRPLRDRLAEAFQSAASVDEWEIAAVHRDHRSGAGACVRATWLTIRPDRFDGAVDFYKTVVLPEIEGLDGSAAAA